MAKNLEITKIVECLKKLKGKYRKEDFLKRNHNDLYNIILFFNKNFPEASFEQKINNCIYNTIDLLDDNDVINEIKKITSKYRTEEYIKKHKYNLYLKILEFNINFENVDFKQKIKNCLSNKKDIIVNKSFKKTLDTIQSNNRRESYLKNNYLELYNDIIKSNHMFKNITFKHMIFNYIYDIKEPINENFNKSDIVDLIKRLKNKNEIYIKTYLFYVHSEIEKFNIHFLNIHFDQKIFNYINDIKQHIKCALDSCDNDVNFQNGKYNKFCSSFCSSKDEYTINKKVNSDKKTLMKRYGVDNVFKIDKVQEKIEKTFLEKYNVKHISQSKEIIEKSIQNMHKRNYAKANEKRKKTLFKKYGIDNIVKLEHIQDKIKETNNQKYNVDYPLLNDEICQKKLNTYQKNWGGHPLTNKELIETRKEARKKTMDDKWIDLFKNKLDLYFKNKMLVKYIDVEKKYFKLECVTCKIDENYTINILNNRKNTNLCLICNPLYSNDSIKKYNNMKLYDMKILDYKDKKYKIEHISKNHTFEIGQKIFYDRLKYGCKVICTICNNEKYNVSNFELELLDFLKLNYNGKIIQSNRTILDGLELDIYLPEYKLGIEFNGLYWHSELFKNKEYHLNKTLECKKRYIELLHIFEDDWMFKQDIIKSIIKNKLNLIQNKIYARKCVVKEIKSNIARSFLDNNHIQGFSKSSYKLGLYYNNDLVSLMTFGYRHTNSKKEFELIRFCNKINLNVIGAASKLFKHFLNNYKIDEKYILSYADISLFNGNMYNKLNFKEIHLTKPNYFWVVNNIRHHRFKYNKQKLIKEGYSKDKTEVEIMHELNYYRIYGCGQVRYEYHF